MRKLLPAVLLLVVALYNSRLLYAQQYTFTYYNAANGLPSSEIISVAIDEKGFLWVGTVAGLSRFDGYQFSNYQYDDSNRYIGTVNVIRPGAPGSLWVGASSGLYYMQQGTLHKVSADINSPQGINDILLSPGGNMWLATENGPAVIAETKLDKTGSSTARMDDFVLPGWTHKNAPIELRRTLQVKMAADGTIFFSQYNTVYKLAGDTFENVYKATRKEDQVLSLFPVSKRKLYVNCALSEMHKVEDGINYDLPLHVFYKKEIAGDHEPVWYAGTSGIACFYPQLESASVFINTLDEGVIWPSNVVAAGKVLWLATHDGLLKIKPAVFNTHQQKKYDSVQEAYSFIQLKNGDFIEGGNRGRLWKKMGDDFVHYLPGGITMVTRAEIRCLLEDPRGWLWAGTGYQGLSVYRDGHIDHLTKERDSLHDNTIYSLLQGIHENELYAIGDHGVSLVQVNEQGKITVKPFYFEAHISKHAQFYAGVLSPGGQLWVGGEEGLFYLGGNRLNVFSFNGKTTPVNDLKMAADGSLWIATSGQGILKCRFDKSGMPALEKQYNMEDGLNTNLYLSLLIDKKQDVWAASHKGLSCLLRQKGDSVRMLNFDEADGFILPGYNNIKLYQQADSTIWAGTTHGIASFHPQRLHLSPDPPVVYVTGAAFLNNSAPGGLPPGSLSASPVYSYENNSLVFSYTAIDFSNQASVRYQYKLDGADGHWRQAGFARSVTYQNLPVGTYTFRVKALNGKGLWSRQEASFVFSIAPPFWQRWWFRGLSLVLIAAVVIAFVKRREKRAARAEAEKTAIEAMKAVSYRHQLEMEQVINFFVTSINQQHSIDEMIWDVTKNCISTLGFEDCVIYLLDDERKVLVQKAAWGPKTTAENRIVNPIEIPLGRGIVGSVALTGKAEIINDTSLDERYIVDDASRLAELAVPIMDDQKIIGVIDSEHSAKDFYTDRHLYILTTIASLLAGKIDKMKAGQQAREKEIELLKLNKDLATWQITALRAQMNPHFIFNAMNSIQQFTLQNDSVNANLYISKFSTLLRKVIHTSQTRQISLEEEMEQLQLYLDIETLRMGAGFTYHITAAEEIEADALKMPGMLVQPFVENALKHGLPLQEGEKKLTVHFFMPDDHHLHAIITDNGIGRKRAAALKQQQTLLPHVSRGIQLVKERLQLLEQYKDHHSAIFINDLPGDAGTQVTLVIPIS